MSKPTRMTAPKALALDTDFYSENDEEYGWGVFGNNSGFCYLLSDRQSCIQEADRLYLGGE